MEPQNDNPEPQSDKNALALNKTTAIILSVLVAVIILLGLGLVYTLINHSPPTPIAGEQTPTEDRPPIPPTFTPTSSPTPKVPPTPTATLTATPSPTPSPSPTPTFTPTPIVFDLRELGYLTTVEFTTATFVELTKERLGPNATILLMAVGKIQAGIDMRQIKDADVTVDGTQVKIVLPRAIVTSVELLPGESRIFDSGWFPPEGLEQEAFEQARIQLSEWASTRGNLLDMSEQLGQAQLESFLRQLGFEEVEITFRPKNDL